MRKFVAPLALFIFLIFSSQSLFASGPRIRQNLDGQWQIARAHLTPLMHRAVLNHWQWKRAGLGIKSPPAIVPASVAAGHGGGWQPYQAGQMVFHGHPGYAWFQTTLPTLHAYPQMLEFQGVVTRAVIYLNGNLVTDHRGGDFWFQVPLMSGVHKSGKNILTILVHSPSMPILQQVGANKKPTLSAVTLGTYAPQAFAPTSHTLAAGFRPVLVPNDCVVDGKFNPHANGSHGYLHVYPVWYRKTFSVPAAAKGRVCQLRFGGVLSDAVVYLNGHYVGEHADGYSPFRLNVSSDLNYGAKNTLVVYVDPRLREGWWYEGGGIYRHVSFVALHRLHISRWGTFVMSQVPGLIKRTRHDGYRADANLILQTTVHNQTNARQQFVIRSAVYAPNAKLVGTCSTAEWLGAHASGTFNQSMPALGASLWSLHHCNLYRLKTSILSGGKVVDAKHVHFGIRTIAYRPNSGFYLDGRRVELQGTCNHQDFPAVGVGAPHNLWWWRVSRLKLIGSNAYRCSHNAVSTAFYRACDHLGMLVMDENRQIGDTREGGTYSASKSYPGVPYGRAQNLKTEILRDRNYPCVIMWSLANEEIFVQGNGFGEKLFRHMMKIVRKLDPTRPITSAMNGGYPHGFAQAEDLLGINYNPGAYDAMHRALPHMPIFGSEVGSSESDRGVMGSWGPTGMVTQYTVHSPWSQLPWNTWRPIGKRPFIAGGFVWTGFDYRGEPTPFGWPDINSHFGLLDICGFRKPDSYYYQAAWSNKPMVYIQPQWNLPKMHPGAPIVVRCFSNCQKVQLLFNRKPLGKPRPMPRFGYVDWHVQWHPGVLRVRGYNGSTLAASYTDATPGRAAHMVLTNEWPKIVANGLSIAPVAVRLYDDRGRIASASMRRVTFTISGPGTIAGTSDGNPASHIPNNAHYSRAFYGRCMVLVRAGDHAGRIVVTAHSPGLPPASLTIKTVARLRR